MLKSQIKRAKRVVFLIQFCIIGLLFDYILSKTLFTANKVIMEIVIKANNEVDSKVFFKQCDLFGARGVAPLMAIRTNA